MPGQLAVQVVEIVVVILVFQEQAEQGFRNDGMQPAGTERVTEPVLDDGPLDMETVVEHAHGQRAVGLLHIAVVGADVDDAGDAAAVAGREGALVEGDVLDCFRLEDGEQAEQVVHIIDRYAVQHHEVLLRTAAPHVQACEAFLAALDAGQQLQCLDDVGLAEERRRVLDLLDRHFQRSEIDRLHAGVPAGNDAGGLQFGIAPEGEVEGGVALQVEFQDLLVVTEVGCLEAVSAGRKGQGIETEFVGGGAGASRQDAGADERFAGSGVGDVAAEGHAAGGSRLLRCGDGLQHDIAAALLPGQAGAVESLPERGFQRKRGRQVRQAPGCLERAPQGGVV